MIRLIIFDLMGTLLDSISAVEKARQEQVTLHNFRQEGYELDPKELERAINWAENTVRTLKGEERHKKGVFTAHIARYLGLNLTREEQVRIENKWQQFFLNNLELIESAREILDYLRETEIEVVLVSNGRREEIEEKLEEFELKDYFSQIISSEEVGQMKSELEPFRYLLKERAIDSSQCLMVGNRKDEDAHAKRVGMKTAILKPYKEVKREKDVIEPDYELDSLLEIKDILN